MPRIEDIYNTNTVIDYVNDLERDYTLGDTLFPEVKVDDIDVEMVLGGNNTPVSATVKAWDSESEIGDREAMDVVKMQLAPVSRKIRLGERDIIKLQNPRTNAEMSRVLSKIYDDAAKQVEAVRTRFEAMRFELISTGRIVFNENGYQGTLEYGVPSANRKTSNWADPAADPIKDLKEWQSQIAASTGVRPTRILTTEVVAGLIEENEIVRLSIFGNSNQVVTREDLNAFLSRKGLPVIATDDRTYRIRKGAGYETRRFVPEGSLSIFPEGELGNLIYGPTAEELELSDDPSVVVDFDGPIVTTVYKENDPVGRWTKAAGVGLPSFPVANQVIFATIETEFTPEEPEDPEI